MIAPRVLADERMPATLSTAPTKGTLSKPDPRFEFVETVVPED